MEVNMINIQSTIYTDELPRTHMKSVTSTTAAHSQIIRKINLDCGKVSSVDLLGLRGSLETSQIHFKGQNQIWFQTVMEKKKKSLDI